MRRILVFLACVVLALSPAEFATAADEVKPCAADIPRISYRGCFARDLTESTYRDVGRELAYDYLLRNDSRDYWDSEEMARLARDFNRLAGALGLYAGRVHLGYRVRTLEIEVSDELRSELAHFESPADRAATTRARPEEYATFEAAARKSCVQCIYTGKVLLPHEPHSRVLALLAPDVNPMFAIRSLRAISGVRAVGLSKLAVAPEGTVRVVTGVVGDAAYLRATSEGITRYAMTTPDAWRDISDSEAANISGLRFRELPAEVWLPDTQSGRAP